MEEKTIVVGGTGCLLCLVLGVPRNLLLIVSGKINFGGGGGGHKPRTDPEDCAEHHKTGTIISVEVLGLHCLLGKRWRAQELWERGNLSASDVLHGATPTS